MRKVYELSLLDGASGVQLLISSEAREFLAKNFTKKLPFVELFSRKFGLNKDKFVGFGLLSFGYGGILELDESNGAKVIVRYTQEQPLIYLSASLFILFRCMNLLREIEEKPIEPMEIDLELTDGNGGRALSAQCSVDFHRWLNSKYGYKSKKAIPEAQEAMLYAGSILRGNTGSTLWKGFVMAEMTQVGGFSLHCDENCCCMSGGSMGEEQSSSMGTHNSDSLYNQLNFLAGLAAISGQYLKDRAN